MLPRAGTYVLILHSAHTDTIDVGRRGPLSLVPGHYAYVGSAFGPGGVLARVRRHCLAKKARHWHIDYLREVTTPVAAWYSHAPQRLEHDWARALAAMPCAVAIEGFGCSDCRCVAHLFQFPDAPDRRRFERAAGTHVEAVRVDGGGVDSDGDRSAVARRQRIAS